MPIVNTKVGKPIKLSNLVNSSYTALFAVVGATIVGCTTVPFQTDATQSSTIREPVTDPLLSKGGSFFRFHEKMLAQSNPEALAVQIPGGVVEKIKSIDADALADSYIRSYEGAKSNVITMDLVHLSFRTDPSKIELVLGRVYNVITMPDGARVSLPILQAFGLHLWLMRTAAETMRERDAPKNLSGSYFAETNGSCPFTAGPVNMTQAGFLVEGVREGRLLLSGAVGHTQAVFIAEEIRYSARTITGGSVQSISFPDRPSEVYHATLGQQNLTLNGTNFRTCSIILRPTHNP